MASDSMDLEALQTLIADNGEDFLLGARDVRRLTGVISRGWWCSFGYESALAAIQTRLREVSDCVCCFLICLFLL
jgi:hypothetical protein